jgi:hypothetical protein
MTIDFIKTVRLQKGIMVYINFYTILNQAMKQLEQQILHYLVVLKIIRWSISSTIGWRSATACRFL